MAIKERTKTVNGNSWKILHVSSFKKFSVTINSASGSYTIRKGTDGVTYGRTSSNYLYLKTSQTIVYGTVGIRVENAGGGVGSGSYEVSYTVRTGRDA